LGVGSFIYSASTGRYLFLLRDGAKYAGYWGLAGGKVEHNELIMDALYREIQEELGMNLRNKKMIPIDTFTSESRTFTFHTFFISVGNEFVPTLNSESKGYCWVKLADVPHPLHPGVWKTYNFSVIQEKLKMLESLNC
jgi:8-oxo-dGTP pyrophosphatase MutT (NUDIX family)